MNIERKTNRGGYRKRWTEKEREIDKQREREEEIQCVWRV